MFVAAGVAFAGKITLEPGGKISSPVEARDAARKLERPVTILVDAGVYELAAPLELGPEDSDVVWEGAGDSKPVFSGGRRITGWKKVEGGLWKAELPEVKEGKWYFEQLWVNGLRAVRARSPNVGFFNAVRHASSGIFPKPAGVTNAAEWARNLSFHSFVTGPSAFAEIAKIGGRKFPEAVGVIIGHSGENEVRNCDIGDFYYSAISIGWVWGYGESLAQRNRVEDCHLHHLGWGVISDMGGVYLLGPAFGTVISGNHIHDVASYRYGGWGLYTDEGSSGVLMEKNLVHDTSESTFHQHYGYYNTVRNNILAFGAKAQIQRSRPETHLSFIFENNIVVWDPAVKLLDGTKYNWNFPEKPERGYPQTTYIMRNNFYMPVGGAFTNKLAENWTWAEWQKSGRDAGSVFGDAMFADVAKLYATGRRRQGLLQIFHDYCLNDRSRCATCPFPAALRKFAG